MAIRRYFMIAALHGPSLAGAAILCFAASVKSRESLEGSGAVALVGIEVCAGLGLVTLGTRRQIRLLGSLLFLLFGTVALDKAIDGSSDCGCMGAVQAPPSTMLVVDGLLAAAFGVSAWTVPEPSLSIRGLRCVQAAGICLGVLSSIVGFGLPMHPGVGMPWAYLGRVDIRDDLSRGEWVVVLFRSDCAKCAPVVQQWRRRQRVWATEGRPEKVAFVDVVTPSSDRANWEGVLRNEGVPPTVPEVLRLRRGVVVGREP